MRWVDLFSIETFTASGRWRSAPDREHEVDGGAPPVADEAAPVARDDGDEWDAETLDEIPEVDEIGPLVHDDPRPPVHALLVPPPRLWSRPPS